MRNNQLLTDEQRELYSLMLPVYGASVNQKTYCKILNISLSTAYKMRNQGLGASYKKLNSKSKSGTVVYPLQEIVKYLTESNVQTAYKYEKKKYNWILFSNKNFNIYIFEMIVKIEFFLRFLDTLIKLVKKISE